MAVDPRRCLRGVPVPGAVPLGRTTAVRPGPSTTGATVRFLGYVLGNEFVEQWLPLAALTVLLALRGPLVVAGSNGARDRRFDNAASSSFCRDVWGTPRRRQPPGPRSSHARSPSGTRPRFVSPPASHGPGPGVGRRSAPRRWVFVACGDGAAPRHPSAVATAHLRRLTPLEIWVVTDTARNGHPVDTAGIDRMVDVDTPFGAGRPPGQHLAQDRARRDPARGRVVLPRHRRHRRPPRRRGGVRRPSRPGGVRLGPDPLGQPRRPLQHLRDELRCSGSRATSTAAVSASSCRCDLGGRRPASGCTGTAGCSSSGPRRDRCWRSGASGRWRRSPGRSGGLATRVR